MRTTIIALLMLFFSSLGISQTDDIVVSNDFDNFNQEEILSKPFPNPVKESTQINYNLPSSIDKGVIVIFNLLGNEVRRIRVDNEQKSIILRASDFKDGTYFYQLEYAGKYTRTKRLIISK